MTSQNWRPNGLTSPAINNHSILPLPLSLISYPKRAQTKNNSTRVLKKNMGKKQYWLLKTEPGEWSWEDQAANGGLSNWDGVKNKQAQKNLKSMRLGDLCFFYHSGTKARQIVGVVSVVKEWYDDDKDGAVDVKAVGEMRRAVDLKEMKETGQIKDFGLFRQPRLSVVPVGEKVWERICEMGGGFGGGDDDDDNGDGGGGGADDDDDGDGEVGK